MVSSDSEGRDKRKRITPLEAFFCVLATFGICAIIYTTGGALGVETGRNEVNARQHYDQVKKDALESCVGLEGPTLRDCATEAIEIAQDQSVSRQDLYAQQDMAKWAFWMVSLTFGTVLVTGVGVYFVKRTLDTNTDFLDESVKATVAMQKQSEIAEKTLGAQIASSRPLMVFDIENATFEGPPFESPWNEPKHALDSHIRPTFSFKNIGNQPCWILSAWLTFYVRERDTSGTVILPNGINDWFRVANTGLIQPDKLLELGGGFYGVTKEEIEIIEKGGGAIIFGMCQYKSLAGNIHCTRYAYHIPIQRPHNKTTSHGYPVDNPTYWRDGLVKSAKLDHSDPISWIED